MCSVPDSFSNTQVCSVPDSVTQVYDVPDSLSNAQVSHVPVADMKANEQVIQQLKDAMLEQEETMEKQDTVLNEKDNEILKLTSGIRVNAEMKHLTTLTLICRWKLVARKMSKINGNRKVGRRKEKQI